MFRRSSVTLCGIMNTAHILQEQAITAAEKQKWDDAVEANSKILEIESTNISAMNRLGFCYLQKGDRTKAKKTYQRVLEVDQYNGIAKKYLTLLANSKGVIPTAMGSFHENFIEEPGKTKTVALCRLADPSVLSMMPVATTCRLTVKQHWIAVETDHGVYLGSLPDDLSHTLSKLIKGGNTYKTVVKAASKTSCVVFIKEISRSKKQAHLNSFPSLLNTRTSGIHEELLVDSSPVDVSETGHEREVADDFVDDFTEDAS